MNLAEIKQAAIDYALAEFTSVAWEKDIPWNRQLALMLTCQPLLVWGKF